VTIQDYLRLLRTRWITISVVILLALGATVALNLLTTPQYQASTRLFVSTTSGPTANDIYLGNESAQQRVFSYAELLMGANIAQRTIDKLNLDMSADQLRAKVKATAKAETVLIDVTVQDESPERARDIADTLSDEFVIMVRELETPPGGESPDARVTVEQHASVPNHPVVPKTTQNLAIGLLAGVVLGIGAAFIRHVLDNTIKDQRGLEQTTGVGVVGNIPLDKERRKHAAISFDTDHSPSAESFRKLRTNLQFLSVDNPPRAILVTSSVPNEGKSVTALNIALALAEAGRHVVLIDGDMRRPMLDKLTGLVGTVGFSTVLSGQISLADALQKTKAENLTVLTAGAAPPNPSELLGSLAARRVLEELRGRFEYVVIDSSPLLAVTDAAVLAANADGVLIMARFGETKREQLAYAVKNLGDVGAKLLGAVLTMTPPRRNTSYNNHTYVGYYSARQEAAPATPSVGGNRSGRRRRAAS
jgi:capsular exopolysaccharide synthesis family protein